MRTWVIRRFLVVVVLPAVIAGTRALARRTQSRSADSATARRLHRAADLVARGSGRYANSSRSGR